MNRWHLNLCVRETVRGKWATISRRREQPFAGNASLHVQQLEDRCMPIVGSLGEAALVGRGDGYDGVVKLMYPDMGTGSLVYTGRHILTAAHIADGSKAGTVIFQLQRGTAPYDIPINVPANKGGDVFQVKHPGYNGNLDNGFDVSVLKLTDPEPGSQSSNRFLVAPYGAEKFDLYAANDEIGSVF